MSIHQLICPSCGSNHIVKNGTIHNKKQKYNVKIVRDNLSKIVKEIILVMKPKNLLIN